jgi:hypothetical protein
MKRIILLAAMALLLGTGAAFSAPSSNQVLVVYHGQTEANREAYQFLKRNLAQLAPQVSLSATQDTATVKPGVYRAVVVLNSGVSSGVDPALKAFVASYPAKGELFQINLVQGSKDTAIQSVPAAQNNGVDAVSAASAWSEGPDKMTWVKVHQQWIQMLADFLNKR